MKNILSLLLSILLIVSGLTLVFTPNINSQIIKKRTAKNAVLVNEVSSEQLQTNLKTDSEFDFDSVAEISPSNTFFSAGEIDDNLLIGRLLIPSIDLNLSVYNGVTNSILQAGVGTMKPNLKMGEGNFPIAGHYASDKKTLFGNLTAVALGDLIYLTDNDKMYAYKVYDTQIVEPAELDWIQDNIAKTHEKPVISLMNCYYDNGKRTDKRYFVFGELIDSYQVDQQAN